MYIQSPAEGPWSRKDLFNIFSFLETSTIPVLRTVCPSHYVYMFHHFQIENISETGHFETCLSKIDVFRLVLKSIGSTLRPLSTWPPQG